MGRRYEHPPVIEAQCEFLFHPSAPWDLTIMGLVYERIKTQFPHRRSGQRMEVKVESVGAGLRQRVQTSEAMQFLQEDGRAMIQVAQDAVTANYLAPYSSWTQFLPLIRTGLEAYQQVAKPKGLRREALRFINRIAAPPGPIELSDYLEFLPSVGPRLPQDFADFMVGVEFPFDDSKDALRLQLATAPSSPEYPRGFLLSLEYLCERPTESEPEIVIDWVETAHSRIEETFEGCITDRLRAMFRGVST